ncbi:SDR family NAD(P)-dependent oxidoreductase [Streptomyces sp. NPDC057101]|uniref:SDR family NAD(P)-dependent oxidoreductase n=1 Tax=Streptomyces sp. NPDC057101 TaxID=3346020 RepID=UPI0036262D07
MRCIGDTERGGVVLAQRAEGSTAVVTGAGRGIGRSIAVALVRDGCRVAICDVDGDAVRATLAALGQQCHGAVVDVSDAEAVHAFVIDSANRLGALDVMVNNAGVMPCGPLSDHSVSMLQRLVEVNLLGTQYGCRSALEVMSQQGKGHIVNIASATAFKPLPGLAPYSATKAAILAFGEALRCELRGTGIRITTVCPYTTLTAASTGLGAQRGFSPIHPDRVGHAVAALRRRPKPIVHVPPYLAALPWLGLLPGWAQALLDHVSAINTIGLQADLASRTTYMESILREESRPSV